MLVKIRTIHLFLFMIIAMGGFCETLPDHTEVIKKLASTYRINKRNLDSYLLPKDHFLQEHLKHIFHHSHMFHSAEHFKKAGFKVKLGHRQLMVGVHSSIPEYLFKKFPDSRSQSKQLQNYITRIKGAKILRKCIEKHNFKHFVVPQKWLYKLPDSLFKKNGESSYILIVENMDIYDEATNRALYYNMDIEILTELCIILHEVGGCDAFPRNQPFTRYGKIAFVDTEHVGKMKEHFIKHIVPALNKELQAYAVALWMKLEEEAKANR